MGKVSPNHLQPKSGRRKRRIRNSKSKYLKPGAFAQLQSINSLCGPSEPFIPDNPQSTPRTPSIGQYESGSMLESLPMDLLVKILCHLHHDELGELFHVSQKIRKASVIARQFHFNYTTPARSRQDAPKTTTPLPTDHWPFMRPIEFSYKTTHQTKCSKRSGKESSIVGPHTPNAPKHGPRPPSRLKFTEMRQVAAVLFQESSYSSKSFVPSVLQKPICKSMGSNRVLFCEDELCQAVAQNKLR